MRRRREPVKKKTYSYWSHDFEGHVAGERKKKHWKEEGKKMRSVLKERQRRLSGKKLGKRNWNNV